MHPDRLADGVLCDCRHSLQGRLEHEHVRIDLDHSLMQLEKTPSLVSFVGFGGGGDLEYLNAMRWITDIALPCRAFHFAFARAPLLGEPLPEPWADNASSFSTLRLPAHWAAFDGGVSAAGYHTFGELMHHGVPTIRIAFEKPSEDQAQRIRRAVQRGAGWQVERSDNAAMHDALRDWMLPSRRSAVAEQARSMVPVNGAITAAAVLAGESPG